MARRDFDECRALTLVALPLSCIDRPQNWPIVGAFYGCYDWHSAVHSTWTMAVILRRFPQISVAGLIREKLNDHLTKEALDEEIEFFQSAEGFEIPYGRSWLLKLFAEVRSWDDADAVRWAQHLSPLAKHLAKTLMDYAITLETADRIGLHGNSAYSLSLILEYADAVQDFSMRQAIEDAARRLFAQDVNGPVAYEPSPSDFLSPCLEEARLMSRVLDQNAFVSWFDGFMPAPDSDGFRPLVEPFDISRMNVPGQLSAKSHLIGLSFSRAEAMQEIARRLGPDDLRIPVYQRIAAIHGKHGWDNLFAAGYSGSHWLSTFALRYELASSEMEDCAR